MNRKEFEALEVGDVVKYVNGRSEYIVIEKRPDGKCKVQRTHFAATASLWERIRGGD